MQGTPASLPPALLHERRAPYQIRQTTKVTSGPRVRPLAGPGLLPWGDIVAGRVAALIMCEVSLTHLGVDSCLQDPMISIWPCG
jgi:hypothetical protein